ncbi:uncharacterized protein [Henckelia pumila]|uniref:uncharacterized protein n=1 Tax=Henckelia pumila TaxID=405737 RepID=UPI003C6E4AC6
MFEETTGNHARVWDGAMNSAAETEVYYRTSASGNGGAYQNGHYMFVPGPCMVSDSREQAVYSFIPIMPSERKMIVFGGIISLIKKKSQSQRSCPNRRKSITCLRCSLARLIRVSSELAHYRNPLQRTSVRSRFLRPSNLYTPLPFPAHSAIFSSQR